jgi:hypothetical protein
MVISGVDNGEGEDDVESEDAYGDTVLMSGSDVWYNADDDVGTRGFCVGRVRLCIWG